MSFVIIIIRMYDSLDKFIIWSQYILKMSYEKL